MKKVFFLLLVMPVLAFAQEKGIQFVHNMSWDQVKAKAKAEHKYIMVDCYTTWCGWCKYMDKNVYPNDTVGNVANANFVSVRVQFDTSRADNDEVKSWYATAHDFLKKYNIDGYPTILFFNGDGEIVDQHIGASMNPADFVTVLNNAKDPKKQYFALKKRFDGGDTSPEFLKNFAYSAQEADDIETALQAAHEYIATQKDLFTKDNLGFLSDFTQSSKDTGFAIMKNNAEKVDSILGKKVANQIVRNIVFREVVYPEFPHRNSNTQQPQNSTQPNWTSLEKKLKDNYPNIADELFLYSKVIYYQTTKDWNNFQPAVVDYMKNYSDKASNSQLNQFAWTVFNNCKDTSCIGQALEWSKKSLQSDSTNPYYIDTYANILYKMGRKKEAIAWEKKALNIAPDEDKTIYQSTLDKMNKDEKTWN